MKFQYPEARRDDTVVDDFHGQKVTDHYRWLEDEDAKETKNFVDAQNSVTVPFLNSCHIRDKLQSRITELWDYPKYGCPFKQGPHYFHYFNTGLQNQSVLYIRDRLDGEPRVFLDPNSLSADGTVSISGTGFSDDGSLLAYGLSEAGSDWISIHFRDVKTGLDLDDVLVNVKFSCMTWTHDNLGIFYNKYPDQEKSDGTETTSNYNQMILYHRLGTKQSDDIICARWPENPSWMGIKFNRPNLNITGTVVSDCGRYVICVITNGCDLVNQLHLCDLKTLENGISGELPFVAVVDNFDAEYEYITNEGSVFTFKTNLNSPRYKLINIDFNNFAQENWVTLIAEHDHNVLESAICVNGNKLVLSWLHDVKSVISIHDLTTGQKIKSLPLDIGYVSTVNGMKKDTEIFYQFVSFLTPGITYHCDMTQNDIVPQVHHEIKLKGIDSSLFEVKQIFYPSLDDVTIPMFIVHKKSLTLDRSNPVYLYGYGGFNIAITPTFSVSSLVFMNHLNGVLAVANLRGGGEYGETWHKSGILEKKQNVFNDFQAAAKYLVKESYTEAKKITIVGWSNGGLLVAACANQSPELFGCVIAQVGVMDMLRFQKFTAGHTWTTDFGCADEKDQFPYIYKYSPLHNIRVPEGGGVQYPSTLLLTGDHDDRVVPLHSLKFIAELQHQFKDCDKQTNPLMIRIDKKSGHGAGKPTTKQIEELTDIYCFITKCIGLEWSD